MTAHVTTINLTDAAVLAPHEPPAHVQVGDIVSVEFADGAGVVALRGSVTEIYRHDQVKIEVVDIAGLTSRYSVPIALLRLVRRADA